MRPYFDNIHWGVLSTMFSLLFGLDLCCFLNPTTFAGCDTRMAGGARHSKCIGSLGLKTRRIMLRGVPSRLILMTAVGQTTWPPPRLRPSFRAPRTSGPRDSRTSWPSVGGGEAFKTELNVEVTIPEVSRPAGCLRSAEVFLVEEVGERWLGCLDPDP